MSRKRVPNIRRLNRGAVLRQRRDVTKRQTRKKISPLTVREIGGGPSVTDLTYNQARNQITVEKENNATNEGLDSLRTASVESAAPHVSAIPTVDSWFDNGGGSDDLMLPDDFEHGDPLPELPEGLLWMRLLEGSMRAGICAWDADADAADFDRTTEEVSKDANVIRAEITNVGGTAIADYAMVDIYFSQPIEENSGTDYNKNVLAELIRFRSTQGKQFAKDAEVDGNKLTLTCTRNFDIRETCYVEVLRGLFKNNADSGLVPLVGRGDRFCYVIGVNRQRTGRELAAGDNVVLGNVTKVVDTEGQYYPVFDAIALGGGGGGVSVSRAIVYGGNNNPYEGTDIDTYEVDTYRPYIFTRGPDKYDDEDFARRSAWEGTNVLPDGWLDGDEFNFSTNEYEMLPYGIGFVRLMEGESVGPYSWDADNWDGYAREDDAPSDDPVTIFAATKPGHKGGLNTITIFFNEPVTLVDSALAGWVINTDGDPVTIDVVSDDNTPFTNCIYLVLDRELAANETVTIDMPADRVEDADTNKNVAEDGISIAFMLPKNKYVPVVNRSGFPVVRGQYVEIGKSAETISLADDTEPMSVYPIEARGELPRISLDVIGGNVPNDQLSSLPEAILAFVTTVSLPENWQTFNLTDEDPSDPSRIPPVGNGYGFVQGYLDNLIFGEAANSRGRVTIARNTYGGKMQLTGDFSPISEPQMIPDQQETPEYRLVWEIYG